MKLKIIGLLIIIIGFAVPYILRLLLPTFLYGAVASSLFFWVGILFILSPLPDDHQYNPYLKWARCAIWLNISLTLALVLYFYIMMYFDIRRGVGVETFLFLDLLANPVETIFNRLVPLPNMQQADGTILITHSVIRTIITTFTNLVLYLSIGILSKIIIDKKITSVFSGSRGPCAR